MEHNEDLDTPWWIRSQAEQSVPLASRGKVDVYILAERILKSTRGAPAKWITVNRSRKYDTKQQLLTAIFQELNELETAASRQWQHENAGFDRSRRRDINHTGNMEPTLKGAKSTAHQPSQMNTNAHIVEKKWRDLCTGGWQQAREKILPGDITARGWLFTRWKVVNFDFPWCVKLQSIHVKTSLLSWDACAPSKNLHENVTLTFLVNSNDV